MPDPAKPSFIDLRPLQEASGSLLGYFVHTWYTHYLSVIAARLKRLLGNGLIENLTRPTERGRYVLFDFGALNLEKLAYILGIYVYILPQGRQLPADAPVRRQAGAVPPGLRL
jgi:hypothetical protein